MVSEPTATAPVSPRGKLARLDYERADIWLHQSSGFERMRARSCAKEPWTVAWIEEYVEPGQVLYDIGANVGAYSLVAAKWTGHQARVFAFEPGFANFGALCDNVHVNGCADCITPLPIGLSSRTQLSAFNYRDTSAGAALHSLADITNGTLDYQPAYVQPVLSFRLDDLVKQFGLPWPDHIKLDVDGMEIDVLRGAHACLERPSFRSLMIELTRKRTERILAELTRCGLEMTRQIDKRNKQGEAMSISYGLFTRSSASA